MAGQWYRQVVAYPADAVGSARAYAGAGELAWLGSPISRILDGPPARYAFLGIEPVAVIQQYEGHAAELTIGRRVVERDVSGWALWRRAHDRLPRYAPLSQAISPGWVGYVGFEMGRHLERLPASRHEDLGLPLMRLALYDSGVVLDNLERRAWLVHAAGLRGDLGLTPQPPESLVARWQAVAHAHDAVPVIAPPRLTFEMPRRAYEPMIARALAYIAAGDIYQVNLCQRLKLERLPDALTMLATIHQHNPAPYTALLKWDDKAVLSASPELFLNVAGQRVLTRPIKGTRPRRRDVVLDDAAREELLASEKDRAELTMIVDLHRNDLGRVCRYGSVRVAERRRLETHPSVFHTVADVVGQLAPGRDALDVLAACFPAGSVSGVPKIRAIQIIDELEPVARCAYTGAVGVLGLDGRMTFNVAIRTLQMRDDLATLYVGGGIVADSDPGDEYEETLAKAGGILDALRVTADGVRMPG